MKTLAESDELPDYCMAFDAKTDVVSFHSKSKAFTERVKAMLAETRDASTHRRSNTPSKFPVKSNDSVDLEISL
jgi:hypothetical protein